jgi:hypothetical protein
MKKRNRHFWPVMVWLAFAPTLLAAPIAGRIRSAIADTIRWQAFWEGVESLGPNCRPGKHIEGRVLRSQSRAYVFLAAINLEIDFSEPDGRVVAVSMAIADTNAAAVATFLRERQALGFGCIGNISSAPTSDAKSQETGRALPPARPCTAQENIVEDETFSFEIPHLAPPRAIQKKEIPPDRDRLIEAVRHYIESRQRYCGAMNASIPFYSDADPRVYVLIQAVGNCPTGVSTFYRSPEGIWEFGKFIADTPREQISHIIACIRSNTAIAVDN